MLSLLQNRVKSITISKVEISLLFILFIFGVPMIVLIPPGAGYDEEDHLVRVWELSAASFRPGQLSPQELKYPTVFRDFAYRQQGSAGVIDSDFWQSYARASLYERGFVRREIDTKSVYSPALLFPQAIAMRIFGRSANLSALPVFYLCRLAGLLSYLILTGLAVRLIPFGKWMLLVLVVSPMALFQAATLTPDAISNGIGFLFFAGCLRLAQVQGIHWRETGSLVLLIFLLFLAKLNLIPLILLPFLLILPSQFASKRLYAFLLGITLVLFLLEVAGWNWVASRNFDSLLLEEANPRAQLLSILTHLFAFLQTILKDFIANGWVYFQGWINGYGYYYWTPPQVVSVFFLLSLGSVLFMDSTSEQASRRLRIVFILVFVAGYLATIVFLYASFTPVGSDQVFGVQGRYFIPLALPLFLVLSGFSWKRKIAIPSSKWIIIFLTAALSLNLLGILFSFHVPCGSTFYQSGLCYQPLFKDFPGEVRASRPISTGISLNQEIQVTCDGLAELRVLLTPSIAEDHGSTRFILHDPLSGQALLDTSVANDQVRTETWYPLRFEPDWLSAGNQYTLEILSTNASQSQGLQVLYTPQPEFNLGDLHENGQLIEENIVLQYGCATGLRKIGLTGKP
ncbi:MAG TPA: DUF2142 domain-containing protein [Anaerolineales bacterium]|nr:DUF2142 domain-containing protein [Anaerolineales bacterium]